jgi:serine/threonine protein kinase
MIPRIEYSHIELQHVLGRGGCGVVNKGVWTQELSVSSSRDSISAAQTTQVDVAMKKLYLNLEDCPMETIEEFLTEIKLMRYGQCAMSPRASWLVGTDNIRFSALVHEHIVKFYGICIPPDGNSIWMVTEFMGQGCLRTVLDKKQANLSWELRIKLAKDAAVGMDYLHKRKGIGQNKAHAAHYYCYNYYQQQQ